MTIVIKSNDQAYIKDIDTFIQTIQLDSSATPQKQTATAAIQQPDKSTSSLTGTWSDQSASIGNYVSSSGVFLASADASEMNQYEFGDNNSFIYKYLGSINGTMLYIESSGTYKTQGNQLIFSTKKYNSRFVVKGAPGPMKEDKTREVTDTYSFYIGPNKWEAGPFLNLHKDGNYYPWNDYQYNYFKKIQ